MAEKKRVVVGMSGGVDSSIAAALLKEQGYEVIGLMLHLWSPPDEEASNRCCSPESVSIARRVAAILDIPFYLIDAKESFRKNVVDFLINNYLAGVTPNPCIACNRHIRWGVLYNHARSLDANFIATGHYARSVCNQGGYYELHRALDRTKDQSYVLHILTQDLLNHTLFPLGELTKVQVRQIARQLELPSAEKPDSQDLCFLGNKGIDDFLLNFAPQARNPGDICDLRGVVLGKHKGLAFYTIGQRRRLSINAPQPLYVLKKDIKNNILIVGNKADLGCNSINVSSLNWIAGDIPPTPLPAEVMVRYKTEPVRGTIQTLDNNTASITFEKRIQNVAPGQSAVFYQGDNCLGGGIIQEMR